jgi:hypothetical protein
MLAQPGGEGQTVENTAIARLVLRHVLEQQGAFILKKALTVPLRQ